MSILRSGPVMQTETISGDGIGCCCAENRESNLIPPARQLRRLIELDKMMKFEMKCDFGNFKERFGC